MFGVPQGLNMKPWQYWILFAICLGVVFSAMGWVSYVVVVLDRSQADIRRDSAFQENVRLALWRMENAVSPILARESARPYFHYSAFYPAERAYNRMFEELARGDVIIPSPLLTEQTQNILFHFQYDARGELTSPQVPSGKYKQLAVPAYQGKAKYDANAKLLKKLAGRLTLEDLAENIPPGPEELIPPGGVTFVAQNEIGPNLKEPRQVSADTGSPQIQKGGKETDIKADQQPAAQARAPRKEARKDLEEARTQVWRPAPVAEGVVTGTSFIAQNQINLNFKNPQQVLTDSGSLQLQRSVNEYNVRVDQQALAQNAYPNSAAGRWSRQEAKKDVDDAGTSMWRLSPSMESGESAAKAVARVEGSAKSRELQQRPAGAELQHVQGDLKEHSDLSGQETRAGKASPGPVAEKASRQEEEAKGSDRAKHQARRPVMVEEGAMNSLWVDDELLLVRSVRVGTETYYQGCVLDWPALRKDLLGNIIDLLPGAGLKRASPGSMNALVLAALPVELMPGKPPREPQGWTLAGVVLLVSWCCVILAAAAVAVLLAGAMSLSERRGAFVSAVTHELRTPLTTFRMYSEMLADGMVKDSIKRQEYLDTLKAEANRLSHLVENVLSYARLERGRRPGNFEVATVAGIFDRVTDRLDQRAAQAKMELVLESGQNGDREIRTDVSAVEQILFNLVDNACKYAVKATDRRIHIEVGIADGKVLFRVRDHGPGISPEDGRRLFRPFSKSAKKAAETAQGVGLGLALSRRLARQLSGNLVLDGRVKDGASFVLSLNQ
ncbi:MAG: hypothetical protein C0404_07935 [Verrucomicrobia bacterium]|nr:hypothetical protein [Verrucomicrobiota bacterium]